jgi:Tfp pilus assembly protein PilZ
MINNYSRVITPTTGNNWRSKSEKERIEMISIQLKNNTMYKDFQVINAPINGQIVLKIENSISSKIRGTVLLELEEILKKKVDQGVTVWCEPVGDKSKLRQLRGVKIII